MLAGCGGSDGSAADDLIGTWTLTNGPTWEISDDAIAVTGGAVDGFSYTATDATLELTEVEGASDCSQTGTYEWQVTADVLSLTAVSDECAGRMNALDGAMFERAE